MLPCTRSAVPNVLIAEAKVWIMYHSVLCRSDRRPHISSQVWRRANYCHGLLRRSLKAVGPVQEFPARIAVCRSCATAINGRSHAEALVSPLGVASSPNRPRTDHQCGGNRPSDKNLGQRYEFTTAGFQASMALRSASTAVQQRHHHRATRR
jgi:hypothetical protein